MNHSLDELFERRNENNLFAVLGINSLQKENEQLEIIYPLFYNLLKIININ